MITLVNFANSTFESKRKWNSFTGKHIAGFDAVLEYSPEDITTDSIKFIDDTFLKEKGFGNYFWKSIVINDALDKIKDNEYLFYADSGSFFIKSIQPLLKYLNDQKEAILFFQLPLVEKQWTKRDAFIILDCDTPKFTESGQIMGAFILIKKTKKSIAFFKEFQKNCLDKRIISDQKNELNKPNYSEFIAHRHDQSILSLMVKKQGILTINDPTDYGLFPERYFQKGFIATKTIIEERNNNVFILHNRKIAPIVYLIKYWARRILLNLPFKKNIKIHE